MNRTAAVPAHLLLIPLLLCAQSFEDQFQVTPSAINIEAVSNGELPPSQTVLITSSRPPSSLEAVVDSGTDNSPAPAWLSATPRNLTTPSRIVVSVLSSLPAGVYRGRIRIRTRATIAVVDVAAVPVILTVVDRAPTLRLNPSRLSFTLPSGTARAELLLVARNAGSGPLNCAAISASTADPWLSTRLEPGTPCRIRVTALTAGLETGAYASSVALRTPIGETAVPVSLFLSGTGPILSLNPSGFQFEARQENGNAITRNLTVANAGQAPLNFTVDVLDAADAPWLTLNTRSGAVAPGASASVPITVNPAGLAPGQYYSLIQINSQQSRNSPQLFSVAFLVTPAGSPALGTPSPSGLLFTTTAGTAAPAQAITVFSSSTAPVPFQASAQTTDSARWLTLDAATGNTSTGNPARVNVTASAVSLAPGIYTGEVSTIVVAQGSTEVRSVNVTFVVRPRANAASIQNARLANHICAPTRIAATHTGLVSNFVTRTGWPTPMNVRLINDCGDLVPDGQVVLFFSNGDPPLALTSLNNGNYSGTWNPLNPSPSSMSVRADIFAGALSTTVELIGTVAATQAPAVFPGGVLNNFYPRIGGPLAPGMIVQIFGSALGAASLQPPLQQDRLPDQFGGVSVIIGGRRAPLYFLSPGQINAQIPFDLNPGEQHQILVRSGRFFSTPETVSLASSQPGLLGFPDGRLVAQDDQFRLVDSANPTSPGKFLVVYLVGMGLTNPQVETGLRTPATQARTIDAVTVQVDGKPARVLFAGLTPGFVGLYQVNFEVPPDARLADLPVKVIQKGVSSNEYTVPVR